MRVCVVAEYYPGPHDPSRGIWAHRQALAARAAGAEVRVVVLERPLPPLGALRRSWLLPGWARRELGRPRRGELDGIEVRRLRFLSPPRPVSYASWGAWAAPIAGRGLAALDRDWPIDLIHAHYAIPAGHAVRRFARSRRLPVVVSVHGGDVLDTASRSQAASRRVAGVLGEARLVLANSRYTLQRVVALGVAEERLRVVRLGARAPADAPARRSRPTVVTSGYLVPRKRHEDVLRALALLAPDLAELDYLVVGDGPERPHLERLAGELGLGDRVEFTGQLPPERALAAVASCHLMVMPSVDEAFGVVYAEGMAAGLPVVGCAGEGGPEEIAALGEGMLRVPPGDPAALAAALRPLLAEPERLRALGEAARATAAEHLSWTGCGERTLAAYREALDE